MTLARDARIYAESNFKEAITVHAACVLDILADRCGRHANTPANTVFYGTSSATRWLMFSRAASIHANSVIAIKCNFTLR